MNPNAGNERPKRCACYSHNKTKYVCVGTEHMKSCKACGVRVREDLQKHPFYGWESACPHNRKLTP